MTTISNNNIYYGWNNDNIFSGKSQNDNDIDNDNNNKCDEHDSGDNWRLLL